MTDNKNEICNEFKYEMWLFAAEELPKERMDYWNSHLAGCDECRTELCEEMRFVAAIKESTMIELDGDSFNRMIDKAVAKKNGWLVNILNTIDDYTSNSGFYKKAVLAGGFAAVIFIFSILMIQQNPVKRVPDELLDWEGAKISAEIKEISNRFDRLEGNNWANTVTSIDERLKELENKSNEFSFN